MKKVFIINFLIFILLLNSFNINYANGYSNTLNPTITSGSSNSSSNISGTNTSQDASSSNTEIKNTKTIKEVLIVPPSKTRYAVGEKLDLSGFSISVIYKDNTIEQVNKGYTIKGYNRYKKGDQTLTISYKGYSRKFNVKVGKVLPQTGNFFDAKDALLFVPLSCIAAIIFLIVPNLKYKKKK